MHEFQVYNQIYCLKHAMILNRKKSLTNQLAGQLQYMARYISKYFKGLQLLLLIVGHSQGCPTQHGKVVLQQECLLFYCYNDVKYSSVVIILIVYVEANYFYFPQPSAWFTTMSLVKFALNHNHVAIANYKYLCTYIAKSVFHWLSL